MDDDFYETVEELQAPSTRDWLKPTGYSMRTLDHVKTAVYNVGLADERDIKATSLRRPPRADSQCSLNTSPPERQGGSGTNLVQQRGAWGSNTSIPDLIKQHNQRQRPESAKTKNRVRPPSGRRQRPSSATCRDPSIPPPHPDSEARKVAIGVKGAKYEASERPPKGAGYHSVTTGWVHGSDLDLSSKQIENTLQEFIQGQPNSDQFDLAKLSAAYAEPSAVSPPPPPPRASPDLLRMIQSDTEYPSSAHASASETEGKSPPRPKPLVKRPPPAPISFSLPAANFDDDGDDEEVDTARLLNGSHDDSGITSPTATHDDIEIRSVSSYSSQGTIEHQTGSYTLRELPSQILSRPLDDPVEVDVDDDNEEEDADFLTEAAEAVGPPVKHSVTFNEAKNVTVAITPRDLYGRPRSGKVNLKNVKSRVDSGIKLESQRLLKQEEDRKQDLNSLGVSGSNRPPRLIKDNVHLQTELLGHRGKVGRKTTSSETASVPIIGVEYEEEKPRKHKKKKEVETLISNIDVSDSENELQGLAESDSEEVEPRAGSPTKVVSKKVKNYYELMQSYPKQGKTLASDASSEDISRKFKVTKTLQFDRAGLIEDKSINVIEGQASKGREYVPSVTPDLHRRITSPVKKTHVHTPHSAIRRPTSAQNKVTDTPPERPGSRLGYIAVTPPAKEEKQHHENQNSAMKPRPGTGIRRKQRLLKCHEKQEAEVEPTLYNGLGSSSVSGKQNTHKKTQDTEAETLVNTVTDDLDIETNGLDLVRDDTLSNVKRKTEEMNKLIQEIKEGHKNFEIEHGSNKTSTISQARESDEEVTVVKDRPVSATSRASLKENTVGKPPRRPTSAKHTKDSVHVHRRPFSASTPASNHRIHVRSRSHSAGTKRKEEKPQKVIEISTRRHVVEPDTEETREVQALHAKLIEKGVNISEQTLKRALLPPSDETLYLGTTVTLPKSYSSGLISSPAVWLSKEFKRLKLAEKAVQKATERLWEQQREEKRAEKLAMMAELGIEPNEGKKTKKKVKKGKSKGHTHSHKRSNTVT